MLYFPDWDKIQQRSDCGARHSVRDHLPIFRSLIEYPGREQPWPSILTQEWSQLVGRWINPKYRSIHLRSAYPRLEWRFTDFNLLCMIRWMPVMNETGLVCCVYREPSHNVRWQWLPPCHQDPWNHNERSLQVILPRPQSIVETLRTKTSSYCMQETRTKLFKMFSMQHFLISDYAVLVMTWVLPPCRLCQKSKQNSYSLFCHSWYAFPSSLSITTSHPSISKASNYLTTAAVFVILLMEGTLYPWWLSQKTGDKDKSSALIVSKYSQLGAADEQFKVQLFTIWRYLN